MESSHSLIIALFASVCLTACGDPGRPYSEKIVDRGNPRERAVTLSVKPKFTKESLDGKPWYTLVLPGSKERKSIHWPDAAPRPDSLEKKREYQFELLEEEYPVGSFGRLAATWEPELHRVRDGEKILYDASICKKHHVRMSRERVKIIYGLMRYRPGWREIQKATPNEGTVTGGCVVDANSTHTHRWVCPVCVSTRKEMIARLPKS